MKGQIQNKEWGNGYLNTLRPMKRSCVRRGMTD